MAKRRQRSIQLDPPEPAKPPKPPRVAFYQEEQLQNAAGRCGRRITQRIGKTLIVKTHTSSCYNGVRERSVSVSKRSAIVRFADLIEACEINVDSPLAAPWEDDDAYAHDAVEITQWCVVASLEDARQSQGFFTDDNDEFIVVPRWETGIYEHARHHGASKQVARELVAAALQRDIAQIISWREHGCTRYHVRLHYKNIVRSCGNIDSEETAREEICYELAEEVAGELESKGYLVRGSRRPPRAARLAAHRRYLRQKLNSQNWW